MNTELINLFSQAREIVSHEMSLESQKEKSDLKRTKALTKLFSLLVHGIKWAGKI